MRQKNKRDFKKLKELKEVMQNDSGVALLMVLSIVAILTYVLADFTYETKINKLKVYNQQDKTKAKLLAEAGLNFTLAKLRLYKETRNLLAKKKNLAKMVPPSTLEGIITQPFMFPPPMPTGISTIQKNVLQEFIDNTTLDGKLTVFLTGVKGFLNPNNLRIKKQKESDRQEREQEQSRNQDKNENNENENDKEKGLEPHAYIEQQLIETLEQAMEEKKESDDIFDGLYGNLQADILIKELKYFVMDKDTYEGPERGEFDSLYEGQGFAAKHAPLTSISELYLLQGWKDAIVDLVKDKLTVHEVAVIPINEINDKQLKALFPKINKNQIKEFFEYRDGTQDTEDEQGEDPNPFKSEKDFEELIVTRLGVLDKESFATLKKNFANAGLKFGVAGKLYKVTSKGEFSRASYTIEAYIDLPIRPQKKKKKKEKNKNRNNNPFDTRNNKEKNQPPLSEKEREKKKKKKKKKKPKEFLLEPRVVEIKIL